MNLYSNQSKSIINNDHGATHDQVTIHCYGLYTQICEQSPGGSVLTKLHNNIM